MELENNYDHELNLSHDDSTFRKVSCQYNIPFFWNCKNARGTRVKITSKCVTFSTQCQIEVHIVETIAI